MENAWIVALGKWWRWKGNLLLS